MATELVRKATAQEECEKQILLLLRCRLGLAVLNAEQARLLPNLAARHVTALSSMYGGFQSRPSLSRLL